MKEGFWDISEIMTLQNEMGNRFNIQGMGR